MFDCILVIGCGLIGSSILRALSEKKISKKIIAYDKSKNVLTFLSTQKLNIEIARDLSLAAKKADLIIISAPLSAYKEIFFSNSDSLLHMDRNSVIVVQLWRNRAKPPWTLWNALLTWVTVPSIIRPVKRPGPTIK